MENSPIGSAAGEIYQILAGSYNEFGVGFGWIVGRVNV